MVQGKFIKSKSWYHSAYYTNTDIKVNLFLDGNKIENSQEVALLGITIDEKLSFKTHIKNIFRKAKYR